MNIGTLLMTFGSTAHEYYTPWFPKGADNAYFTYEIIRQNFGTGGTPGFTVEVFTKNLEDVGSQGTAASVTFSNLTGTSFYHGPATSLRQLVRLKITVKGGTTPPTGQEGVVYRILPPTRYDKAV
jgi:hypothetical protein